MVELPQNESSQQQPNAEDDKETVQDSDACESEAQTSGFDRRKRISREEVFDEYGHIPGYSDSQGFSNLQFVFTVEEEVEEDEADDLCAVEQDEVTDIISRQQVTQDSASAESDKTTTTE